MYVCLRGYRAPVPAAGTVSGPRGLLPCRGAHQIRGWSLRGLCPAARRIPAAYIRTYVFPTSRPPAREGNRVKPLREGRGFCQAGRRARRRADAYSCCRRACTRPCPLGARAAGRPWEHGAAAVSSTAGMLDSAAGNRFCSGFSCRFVPLLIFNVRLQSPLNVFCGGVLGNLFKAKSQIQGHSGTAEMALGALYPQAKTIWTGKAQLLAPTIPDRLESWHIKKIGFDLLELHR